MEYVAQQGYPIPTVHEERTGGTEILVVDGDVTVDEVRASASATRMPAASAALRFSSFLLNIIRSDLGCSSFSS